jgi:hypothetical protein
VNFPESAFRLGGEIARRHFKSSPGRVNVVPVLVDDLGRVMPVLRALSSVLEGVLLDTTDAALSQPIEPTRDVVRRETVEAAFRRIDLGTEPIAFRGLADGRLDVALDRGSGSASSLSPGEQTILAIARAALHADADEREFALLCYSEVPVDLPYRRIAWDLFTKGIANLPNPTLRTLAVVVEGSIDIARHCQTGYGFRFALDADRLLSRHGRDSLTAWAARIARAENPVVLFLGAGFSASSRMPLGNGLRDRAIRRVLGLDLNAPMKSEELAARFYEWASERRDWLTPAEAALTEREFVQQLTLEQVLRAEKRLYPALPTLSEFRTHHDSVLSAPGPAVLDLATILPNARGRLVLAGVNFDRLVETHSRTALKVFSSEEDFLSAAEYVREYVSGADLDIPYLKFHGSIEDEASCVVTADQTELGVSAGKLDSIRALWSPPPRDPRLWVYVGASMRDVDLLRVFNGQEFATCTSEVWVAPFLVETVQKYADEREAFWRATQLRDADDRLVSETADAFFAALGTAWGEV